MFLLFAALASHAPVAPRLTDVRSRAYRTELRRAAAAPADFAGHWVLWTTGCGAECLEFAAVSKRTGRVVWFRPTLCCWPAGVTEPVGYRRDSDILRVQGVLDERGTAATRRYRFDGRRFRPIRGG